MEVRIRSSADRWKTGNRHSNTPNHATDVLQIDDCRMTSLTGPIDVLPSELGRQILPGQSSRWWNDLVDHTVGKGRQSACDRDSGKPRISQRFDNT